MGKERKKYSLKMQIIPGGGGKGGNDVAFFFFFIIFYPPTLKYVMYVGENMT